MKTRIIMLVFLAVLYMVPFRIAYFGESQNNVLNLICMIITILGSLAYVGITVANSKTAEA